MNYNEILGHFQVKSRKGNEAMCVCPCHNDKKASLSVSEENGKILLYCHAKCETADILNKVGLTWKDLNNNQLTGERWRSYVEGKEKRQIEAVYHYCNLDGQYAFTRIRLSGKVFRYGILEGDKFTYGLNKKRRKEIPAVYCANLDIFKSAIKNHQTVYYSEGEKDVNTLNSHGLPGVTCGGSNDWAKSCTPLFKDANVVILADNDKPGAELAQEVMKDLLSVAKSVKIVTPTPDLPKGDISDFFKTHTVEELEALVNATDSIVQYEATVDWLSQCDYTEKGNLKSTFGNYCKIVENDDFLKDKIFYNSLDGRVMLKGFHWNCEAHPIRDVDLFQIRRYFSDHYQISSKDDVKQAIEVVASEHETHPIRELLKSLKWDGVPRIANLFPKYLGAERSDYVTHLTKLILYGAIQRVMHPGVKFDICVILRDTEQGGGKSTLCRFLALNDYYFTDQIKDVGDDKKTYEIFRGKWICELGEMLIATKTKDVESIKSFLSRLYDEYRDPYGMFSEQRPRQCIFIGTTNKPQFLPEDKTGQRRFAPIFCDKHKAEVHPLQNEEETREYVRQVYAEAMVTGEQEGWPLTYDPAFDDLLNQYRDVSTPEDTTVGMIQEWLKTTKEEYVCTRMLWDYLFPGQPADRFKLRDVADILNLQIQGWEPYGGRGSQKKYRFKDKYDTPNGERVYGVQRAWVRVVADQGNSEGNSDSRQQDFRPLQPDDECPFT